MDREYNRRWSVLAAAVVLVLLVAVPAGAITWGEPDGDGHPNVGLLLAQTPAGALRGPCSGTLIAEDVFLTAAHCIDFSEAAGWSVVGVTFDSEVNRSQLEQAAILWGTPHTHPNYTQWNSRKDDLSDLAVLVLDRPATEMYPDIKPASLPTAGLLDELNARNGLKGQRFTTVGYGRLEPQFGGGRPVFPSSSERRVSDSRFLALYASWLQVSQVSVRGDGGACFGDSGGPMFLGAGADATDVLVSITSTGDTMCVATNVTYRLDLPSARQFLGRFVDIP